MAAVRVLNGQGNSLAGVRVSRRCGLFLFSIPGCQGGRMTHDDLLSGIVMDRHGDRHAECLDWPGVEAGMTA